MTRRARSTLLVLSVLTLLTPAATAAAYWSAGGFGTGTATVATMPAGNQPSASVSGQSVTVAWTQSSFLGSPLGSFGGGGYTVLRYTSAGTTPITPNASCAATIGSTAQCIEAGVPYGAWRYSVTPVLHDFTGAESTKSATVTVATAAPVITAAAQNPTAVQTTGDVQISWAAVTGATGYRVYRRTTGGSFDFGTPLSSPSTPTYLDTTVSATTTYHYVVRAIAGSPAVESSNSNEPNATTITRPAAPSSVTATAGVAARIDVAWPSVAGVIGYNVYRRTGPTYAIGAPLNGSTPQTLLTVADLALVNGTNYKYTVRAVINGASGAQVESTDADSAVVAADGSPPPVPTLVQVTNGQPTSGTPCGITLGTIYVNSTGAPSVAVSAVIPAPLETGETVEFSATIAGASVTRTVDAIGTTTTTLNLSGLGAGAVTLSARSRDLAGNWSTAGGAASVIIKDTSAPALSAVYSDGALGLGPYVISGNSECGAAIRAVKTQGGNVGKVFTKAIASGSSYTPLTVEGVILGLLPVSYDVTSTDLAGNVSATVIAHG